MTSNLAFVLDTNTVVSALLLPRSVVRRAFDHALGHGMVLASQSTLDELDDVLRRPKFNRYVSEEERLKFLSAYLERIHIVEVILLSLIVVMLKTTNFLNWQSAVQQRVSSAATTICYL